jgi:hypothetical protein
MRFACAVAISSDKFKMDFFNAFNGGTDSGEVIVFLTNFESSASKGRCLFFSFLFLVK